MKTNKLTIYVASLMIILAVVFAPSVGFAKNSLGLGTGLGVNLRAHQDENNTEVQSNTEMKAELNAGLQKKAERLGLTAESNAQLDAKIQKKLDNPHSNSIFKRLFAFFNNNNGGQEAQAPVISNLKVASLRPHQAVISWSTDIRANSSVWYGTTAGVTTTGEANIMLKNRTLNHKVAVRNLQANTKYYFVVGSANAQGENTFSSEMSFTTPELIDKGVPVIEAHADITATATSSAGAVVSYTAPKVTDNVDKDKTATCSPASGTTFAVGTTTVKCNYTDLAGNKAVETSFKVIVTADTTAATISNLAVSAITSTSAKATWTTSEPATSKVFFGTTTPLNINATGATFVSDSALKTEHSLNITELQSNQKYYYIVQSTDGSNNIGLSAEGNFTTSVGSQN